MGFEHSTWKRQEKTARNFDIVNEKIIKETSEDQNQTMRVLFDCFHLNGIWNKHI